MTFRATDFRMRTIEVICVRDHYYARMKGNPIVAGNGVTACDAIGSLINGHQQSFNIAIVHHIRDDRIKQRNIASIPWDNI